MGALILAAVFAFLFQPIYRACLRLTRRHTSLAALVTTIIAVIIVVLPLSLLGTQILKESSELYQSLVGGKDHFIASVETAAGQIRNALPFLSNVEFDISGYARQGLAALAQNFGGVFSSVAQLLLNAFVFLAAFYFFLKDGYKLKDYLVALSPLADRDDELIVSRLKLAVTAAVKGNLTIGLVQGTLTGIGFWLFGVPNAVLWGSVAAVAALIPGIGTALVLTPAVIFLFLTSSLPGALGLVAWGVVAVGLVDNMLGPKLVGAGMKLHPLAVFLTVLGGMAFFGPLGFLLGPLAMSVCIALIDIYFSLKGKKENIA
ncbi:MAG: AI-2E family transporter [bacterium]|nr:AI-2E family transporter [bacterium]